ncbi:effector-associated domain EAD1-containing protein [Streptomyces sp. TRM64462]|uniref:effector-associated domain EAD1-containing protein n=1 Tax=Streptomyces sp. TRM64462 TaxID=2741726 RepID=UPI00158614B6|nr:effector-associated domain EAD1-containing protein [Streptomyces sp. TRM64462]
MTADPEALFPEEIRALADIYDRADSAGLFLIGVGYPAHALPLGATAPQEYWERVSRRLVDGIMQDGRRRILARARQDYPYNRVFSRSPAPCPPPEAHAADDHVADATEKLKIMVLGAEPARRGDVRAAAELREVLDAAENRLDVRLRPAATPADLTLVRRFRPDILHLVCHGTETSLILEDREGEPVSLAAVDLAETLRLAADHYDHRLRLLMLRSCDGDRIAEMFTGLADVVIAHRGRLDADCSALFAAAFYQELLEQPLTVESLTATAHIAAQDVVNQTGLVEIRTHLIVLPRTT